jgi:hypothetical protein
MISDGEMNKTKVLDVKKLYNILVDKFFIWNHVSKKKYIWI